MTIDFYFDPVCPWCWITSGWLREVAPERGVEIGWRTFSLKVKNYDMEGGHGNPDARERYEATHRLLRVMEAARAAAGNEAVGDLYLEAGRRIHHDRERWPSPVDLVEAAGLSPGLAAAADDATLDEAIEASMAAAIDVAGYDVGVPLVVFEGDRGFFGPVFSPRPTGDAATDAFDAIRTLAGTPGFWELKRDRDGGPDVGERP